LAGSRLTQHSRQEVSKLPAGKREDQAAMIPFTAQLGALAALAFLAMVLLR
jgi:hypothetical protein